MLERRSRHERDVDADMTVESAAAPESPTRFPETRGPFSGNTRRPFTRGPFSGFLTSEAPAADTVGPFSGQGRGRGHDRGERRGP